MTSVDCTTLSLIILLNVLLYLLITRRQILKIRRLKMYVSCRIEKENMLKQSIRDKERIIESYSHEINSCEREKLNLKEEIVELERIMNIDDNANQ